MKSTLLPDILSLLVGCTLLISLAYGLTKWSELKVENRTLTDKVREKVSSAHDCATCHTNYIFTIKKHSDNYMRVDIDIK